MAAADHLNERSLARRASLGGLLTALSLAAVAAAHFAPTANLALYSLASVCIAIAVIEMNWRGGLAVFTAASLLGLAWPGLAAALPLMLFFGPYPLARAVIDSKFKRIPALVIRILAGNILAGLSALIFAWGMTSRLADRTGALFWPVLAVGLQAALLVYDYGLGLLIQLYIARIRRP